jgi:hypothetical protein
MHAVLGHHSCHIRQRGFATARENARVHRLCDEQADRSWKRDRHLDTSSRKLDGPIVATIRAGGISGGPDAPAGNYAEHLGLSSHPAIVVADRGSALESADPAPRACGATPSSAGVRSRPKDGSADVRMPALTLRRMIEVQR